MSFGGGRSGRRTLSDINVTPLVDVMLVLLIIFMITAPALLQQVEVNLPKSTMGQAEGKEGLTITVKGADDILIDKEKVNIKDFDAKFAAARVRLGDRGVVFLQGDEQVPYGRVMEVMDRIKGAGVDQLGLVVQGVPEKSKGR
ncbi:MAG: biopolymer transporter ExbD [Candidatus Handelsmanbacteria bacterium]|nr:biopolymer transporter ExbD [Candidatus Handelsmanbacteria bacterium]